MSSCSVPRFLFFGVAAAAFLTGVGLTGHALKPTDDGWVIAIHIKRLDLGGNGSAAVESTTPTPIPTSTPSTEVPGDEIVLRLSPVKRHAKCPPPSSDEPETYPENGVKMCPIPGLNNLLYTQINRYYCATRDKVRLNLRDRVCMKYSTDWFRYSEILEFDEGAGSVSVCFGSMYPDPDLKMCEWKHVHSWYGNNGFWAARKKVKFNKGYRDYADLWLKGQNLGDGGYLALHVRRGDYFTHCKQIAKKKEPAWHAFSWNKAHQTLSKNAYDPPACYPTMQQIAAGIDTVLKAHPHIGSVFVSSNDKQLISNVSGLVKSPQVKFLQYNPVGSGLRGVDKAIIDMELISKASAWILNRYSSFSATPYEMAYTEGRANLTNVYWW